MRNPELLLATALLADGCCIPVPQGDETAQGQGDPPVSVDLREYGAKFQIPNQVDALEAEITRGLSAALKGSSACDSDTGNFYKMDMGDYGATEISDTANLVLLSNAVECETVSELLTLCTTVALHYSGGEMVNGFSVQGACLNSRVPESTGSNIMTKHGFSSSIDLSGALQVRTAY